MQTATAAQIINDAAVELGLKSADLDNPFASSDPNILQLCRLLKRVGRSLVTARDWSHLLKEHTFATVDGTASYALPTDFVRMRDATAWNRTTSVQLAAPVDGQTWQLMKASTAAGVITMPFRIFGNLLYLHPTPSTAENIYYEFVSSLWVQPTGQTLPTTSLPAASDDTLWFDEALLVAGLKLAWKRAKGQDTTSTQIEFNQAFEAASGSDGATPVVNVLRRRGDFRLIDNDNLPETGYGS